jgi:hypothetical protein
MRYFAVYGLILWGIGTLAVRIAGQYLFTTPVVWVTVLATLIGIPLLVQHAISRRATAPFERMRAVIALVLPGMVLDCISVSFSATIFPNISDSGRTLMAGWLILVYSLALLTPFLSQEIRATSHATPTD